MPADLSRLVEEFGRAKERAQFVRMNRTSLPGEWEHACTLVEEAKQALLAAIAEICEENKRLKSRASIIGANWDPM